MPSCSYIFLDEAGNFDFSDKGTRYFALASVSARRPFDWLHPLDEFKHDCIEQGIGIEYFHCYNDSRRVRGSVFDRIAASSSNLNVDCLVVDKAKVSPLLRDESRFYPEILGLLLSLVIPIETEAGDTDEVIVITDTIPVNRRRRAVEKAVQTTLGGCCRHGPGIASCTTSRVPITGCRWRTTAAGRSSASGRVGMECGSAESGPR